MRLGIEERKNKTLFLTPFNTIKGTDFGEMFVGDFFNILNSNLDKNFGAYYIEESNNFKIVLDGEDYYLTLDEVTMNNYLFGKDNDFTKRLRKMIDKTEQRDKGELVIKNDKKMKEEIIEQAEQGIIPDDEARKIYLEYLKNNRNFSFKKIQSYFKNLKDDFKHSLQCNNNWFEDIKIWPLKCAEDGIHYFLLTILMSSIVFLIEAGALSIIQMIFGASVENFYKYLPLIFLPQTTYLVPVIKLIQNQIKNRYLRLLESINNRKINKHKIEQLTRELKYGPRELVDKTFAELPKTRDEEKPTSAILQELSQVASRIKYLKEEDKKVCGDMAMAILDEYTKRAKEINLANSSNGIVLDLDGELSLKSDMMCKINKLEEEIDKRMDVTIKNQGIDADYEIVARQIENYRNNENKTIGGEHPPRSRRP